MNLAAKEMKEPPKAIAHAKATLLLQLIAAIAYIALGVAAPNTQLVGLLLIAVWLLHFTACTFVALAANHMGRKWWRYMSWQVVAPFFGPLASLSYLQSWRDSRA